MVDRAQIGQHMQAHYEAVWSRGDAWDFETSEYEQRRFQSLIDLLADRRYGRALEIGCGAGQFTQRLAGICNSLLALDISSAATTAAASRLSDLQIANVEFIAANVMEYDVAAAGPFDLIVLSETIYCLGWLYSCFEVALFAHNLSRTLRPGGRLLLANTYGADKDWLLRTYLIDTYRDLFKNVGLLIEKQQVWSGVKHGQQFDVLLTLFTCPDT
jgi:ubiquinone/menaquinone biosynthesis C-methylase UbiE